MSEVLTYDVMGNIRTLTRDGLGGGSYMYNGNRLDYVTGSTASYGYDANGNATNDGRNGVVLTYNHLNLPVTATKLGSTLPISMMLQGKS